MITEYIYGVGVGAFWLSAFSLGIYLGYKRSADWVERAALAEINAEERTENFNVGFSVRIDTVIQAFVLKGFELELSEDETPLTERSTPLILTFQRRSKSVLMLTWNIYFYILLMPFGSVAYSVGLGCIDKQAKRIEFMIEE